MGGKGSGPKTQVNLHNNRFLEKSPKYDKAPQGTVQAIMRSMPAWCVPEAESDEILISRWDDYFNRCYQNDVRPTIEGLAVAAGVVVQTLHAWEHGAYRPTPERQEITKKAKAYVRYMLATMATTGAVNPVTFIFMAKNYFGMADKVEHVVEKKQITTDSTPDEVRSKVMASMPLEDVKDFDDFEVIEPEKEEDKKAK